VTVHDPRGDSYLCCNNNVDAGTVIESVWAVEGRKCNGVGRSLQVGSRSRVGEMGF
jgi:hypothetical protein